MAEIKQPKWPWPANVGVLGTHPEEVKALQRRVEKNIDASPMPAAAPTNLLTPARNSENMRIGDPRAPDVDPDRLAFTPTHVVFRRVLTKMRRKGAVLFDESVDRAKLGELPKGRREQMRRMLQREQSMLEILDRYNTLAEDVYMRLLAGSKG